MNGPFRIRLLSRVQSDLPRIVTRGESAAEAGVCDAWCNDLGAVMVKDGRGEWLGVRPAEFEYVTFPPEGIPLALTPAGARKLVDELLGRVEGEQIAAEAAHMKGHDLYLSESAPTEADPTGCVCEDVIGRIAIEQDHGDPSVGIRGFYGWTFVPKAGVSLVPTSLFNAATQQRDALLAAGKKMMAFHHDLRKSNPGYMSKLTLQDYQQWNEAFIELPAAIASAEGEVS